MEKRWLPQASTEIVALKVPLQAVVLGDTKDFLRIFARTIFFYGKVVAQPPFFYGKVVAPGPAI